MEINHFCDKSSNDVTIAVNGGAKEVNDVILQCLCKDRFGRVFVIGLFLV